MTACEALSATLDGESPGLDFERLERHLSECSACTQWYADAAWLNRLVRITPASCSPDLTEAVLARARLPWRGRWRRPLRIALIIVALAQLGIGVASLFLPLGMHAGMPVSTHMDHEEAAFNLAFGVVLLLVGCNTRQARTQLLVLGSFVLVLATVSAFDLAEGNVGWLRLLTHVPIVLGLLLSAALNRGPHSHDGPIGTGTATLGLSVAAPVHRDQSDRYPAPRATASNGRTPPAAHREIA